MNQRRSNKFNQKKSKKYGKIVRCSYHIRPVFDNDSCKDFLKSINKSDGNNCRNCKYSF